MPESMYFDTIETVEGPHNLFFNALIDGNLLINQLEPSLEWSVILREQLEPSLEWDTALSHKFTPNLINYPFYYEQPKILESTTPMMTSGCCLGYSVYLNNTGSSGTTSIEVYCNDELKETVNITANNSSYSKVSYFDLTDILRPKDTFKIKVKDVAQDSVDLKVNIYLMTFNFELEKLFFSNLYDTSYIQGINKEYFFKSADKWAIDFNQPIKSIENITFLDTNGNTSTSTSSLTSGLFYNNRILITPNTGVDISQVTVKVRNLIDEEKTFIFYPLIKDYSVDLSSYESEAALEKDVFISAKAYRYSLDLGSTWSSWSVISDDNTLDFNLSEETDGEKTLTMEYLVGSQTVRESISFYYITSEINASVFWLKKTAVVSYSDAVPLQNIKIYYNGVPSDTILPSIAAGFSSFSINEASNEIELSSGTFYYQGNPYIYEGDSYDLFSVDYSEYDYALNYRVFFGFNTLTHSFDFSFEKNIDPYITETESSNPGLIVLWQMSFTVNYGDTETPISGFSQSGDAQYTFNKNELSIDVNTSKDIKLVFEDVAGRTLEIERSFIRTALNQWQNFSVKKDNIEASSFEAEYPPKNTILDSSDYWQSEALEELPIWIRYEFGQDNKKAIQEVSISSIFSDLDSLPITFKLQASNDASNWTDLYVVIGETWLDPGPKIYSFSNSVEYSFYRFYISETGGNSYVKINEITLSESIGGSDITEYTQTEINPGEIHQNNLLSVEFEPEDWGDNPDGPIE